jgi:hypothetical protein
MKDIINENVDKNDVIVNAFIRIINKYSFNDINIVILIIIYY